MTQVCEKQQETLDFLREAFDEQSRQLDQIFHSIESIGHSLSQLFLNQDKQLATLITSNQSLLDNQTEHIPIIRQGVDDLASTVEKRLLGVRNRIIVHNPEGEPLAVIGA